MSPFYVRIAVPTGPGRPRALRPRSGLPCACVVMELDVPDKPLASWSSPPCRMSTAKSRSREMNQIINSPRRRGRRLGGRRHATNVALRELAQCVQHLSAEVTRARRLLRPLVEATASGLLARYGAGIEVAAVLLVAAGDNPEPVKSEAAFAQMCGVAPVPRLPPGRGFHHRAAVERGGERRTTAGRQQGWSP
jgi:hypothetical protein